MIVYVCFRAVTSTFILYLSKSKSNSRKSYSSKSKSTSRKIVLEVNTKVLFSCNKKMADAANCC